MRLLYLANTNPASGVASTIRVAGIASALARGGVDVNVAWRSEEGLGVQAWGKSTSRPLRAGSELQSHAGRLSRALAGDKSLEYLILNQEPDLILSYGAPLGVLRQADRAARALGVRVDLDMVDWYGPAQYSGTRKALGLFDEISMLRSPKGGRRVLAVTTFLRDFYVRRGCQTLVVPPLMDLEPPSGYSKSEPKGPLRICFAGVAGKKDGPGVRNLLQAIDEIDPLGLRFCVDLIGVDAREVRQLLEGDPLPMGVRPHGRLTRGETIAIVQQSDFTVLQRSERSRYAKAGFPSKVVESLLLGTPVIANLSSDLGKYLVDGGNAAVLAGDSYADMRSAIARLADTPAFWTREQIAFHARQFFMPEVYSRPLVEFLGTT